MFAETAKEALKFAKDAVERGIRAEALIQSVQTAVLAFEQRLESRQADHERRMRDEIRSLEGRVRELEGLVQRLAARVDGAQAEAMGLLMKAHLQTNGAFPSEPVSDIQRLGPHKL
jgi:hypothetical protein